MNRTVELAVHTGILAVGVALPLLVFGGPEGLVATIDHTPRWLADYHLHFGPMGAAMPSRAPVPGFYYGPSAAWAFALLAQTGFGDILWWAVQIASLATVYGVGIRLSRDAPPWQRLVFSALFVLNAGLLHNLKWGQVSTPLLALVAAGLTSPWAAPLLGLAGGFKLYPLLSLIRPVAGGQPAVWATGLGVTVLVLAAPFLAAPADSWAFWEMTRALAAADAERALPFEANSQYVPYILGRWGWGPRAGDGLVIGACGLAYATLLGCSLVLGRRDPDVALALVAAGLPLVMPTCWTHYLGFMPLACAALLRGSSPAVQVIIVLAGLLSTWLPLGSTGSWHVYVASGMPAAASLILAGVAVFRLVQRR